MLRPLFVTIFREYQQLKTVRALLYSLSIVYGKIYNANMLLEHQCYVKIIITQEKLKSAVVKDLEIEIASSLIDGYIRTLKLTCITLQYIVEGYLRRNIV